MNLPAQGMAPIPVDTTLTILNGPNKGAVYRVVSSRVTIGRDPDNDIVIKDDPKCSRHHAEILLGPTGYEIRDISDRNALVVNGREYKAVMLTDQSIVTLGQTQLRLSLKPVQVPTRADGQSLAAGGQGRSRKSRRLTKSNAGSPVLWLVAALVIGAIWLSLRGGTSSSPKIRDEDSDQAAELQRIEQLKQQLDERYRGKGVSPNDIGFRQAQEHYVEGFRDYQKGQYQRALASFQACLSLFPQHELCQRYIRLAQKRQDEIIQRNMVVGREYRDQNQYAACRAAFRTVMILVRDPNSPIYKEAKVNFEACDAATRERF